MIPVLPRPALRPTSAVKIIGLGGAGANMLERVALDGTEGAELLVLNTDLRTLNASIAREKIQLGCNLTKGLGTGGDPELGHQAVLEAEESRARALRGRRIVFLCAGLGGGTGSGAAPIVTRIAREEGAFVVVFATMPFTFEGRRRREQADAALNELAVLSNALVTFDNNRMGELVLAKQGIHEAFSAADHMICESIKAVIRLVVRPGLINVGLDDLMSALRTTRSRCLFGSGIADGKDRAAKALRNALASPLLDQGCPAPRRPHRPRPPLRRRKPHPLRNRAPHAAPPEIRPGKAHVPLRRRHRSRHEGQPSPSPSSPRPRRNPNPSRNQSTAAPRPVSIAEFFSPGAGGKPSSGEDSVPSSLSPSQDDEFLTIPPTVFAHNGTGTGTGTGTGIKTRARAGTHANHRRIPAYPRGNTPYCGISQTQTRHQNRPAHQRTWIRLRPPRPLRRRVTQCLRGRGSRPPAFPA
jgi:cell division protein FtsZ